MLPFQKAQLELFLKEQATNLENAKKEKKIFLCLLCNDGRVASKFITDCKPGIYGSCKHCGKSTGYLIPKDLEPAEHFKYSYL